MAQFAEPLNPFVVFCQKTIPLAFDESMSYMEALYGLKAYLEEQIIPTVNSNAQAVQDLTTLVQQLEDYMEHYFDNLDVQQEINNKLDEMAEDGSLTNLIKAYVDPIYEEFESSINHNIETFENSVSSNIELMRNQVNDLTSGSPLVASSTDDMTETDRIYVNTTDGNWYYYDGDSWEIGGTYQSTAVTTDKTLKLIDTSADSNAVGNKIDDINKSFTTSSFLNKRTIECTFTNGRYTKTGDITATSDYKYTQSIFVKQGDILQFTKTSSFNSRFTIRNVCCYKNGTVVSDSGSNNGLDRFVVPAGINYVILTVSKTDIPDTATGYVTIYETVTNYNKNEFNNINDRLKNVDGLIVPKLEYGNISMSVSGWTYSTPNVINAVRTPENYSIPVHAGTVVKLKDYTNYAFQVGFTKPDSTYDASSNYTVADYTLRNDCNIVVSIKPKSSGYSDVLLENVKDLLVIEDPYNTVDSKIASISLPSFILPKKSFATVGHEWNLYFENVMDFMDDRYYIKASGISGKQYKRFLRFTPTNDDIGNNTISLKLIDKETNETVKQASFTLVVSDNTIASKKGLFIGDSLTAGGRYIYLITNVLSENITSIGTLHSTVESETIYNEGRSGWSASNYVNNASYNDYTNAFYNPSTQKFDFSYYMTTNNFSDLDFVMLNLGTNGQGHIEDTLSAMDEMIESIHDYDSNIKIFVSLITPPSGQDGCGNHNGMFSSDDFKYYELSLIKAYLSKYEDKIDNVYVTEPYFNIDVEYDFPQTTIQVSSRNPATMTINNNNVHLNQYGYEKMGDVYYNNIIGRLQ